MHIFCLDYTVSVSKSYPLRVQNKLTTSVPTGKSGELETPPLKPGHGNWPAREERASSQQLAAGG